MWLQYLWLNLSLFKLMVRFTDLSIVTSQYYPCFQPGSYGMSSTDFVNDMSENITHFSLMGILALCKNRRNAKNTNTFFSTCTKNLCMLRLVVLCISWKLSFCFCTGHCIMVSLHLTLSALFATFFSEHLSNLCYCWKAL